MIAVPATAQAATLEASRTCYPNGKEVVLTGDGFAPDAAITFTVNGRRISGNAIAGDEGGFTVTYPPPTAETQDRLVIGATDSEGTAARTRLFVTRQRAVTAHPAKTDNVRTWKAVFKLWGFRRGKAFVHYIAPNGRHRKTVKLGRLKGPCGRLRTRKRRVLPFANPSYGKWKLQFDTRRRYRKRTVNRRVIPVNVFRG